MLTLPRALGWSFTRTLALLALCLHTVRAQSAAPPAAALRLDGVLAQAVSRHPLIEAARARVRERLGARRTAGTYTNPTLTYWVENAHFPGQQLTPPLDVESQTYLGIPLEPLFQRGARVRGADADVRLMAEELQLAEQSVVLDAIRAYFRVATAQVAVETAEDLRQRLADVVTYNRARVAEGKTAEADLIRAQVELDRVGASVALERVELTRAFAALAPFLERAPVPVGTSAIPVVEVDPTLSGATSPTMSLAEVLRTARTARPDLRAARARLESARASVAYQQSLSLRTLSATFGSKRTAGITSMIAGFTLPLPLLDRNRGEVARARAAQDAAQQELQWSERRADADVQAAYGIARVLSEQVVQLRDGYLARAEESRRIALEAYTLGAVSLLQVLDASRTLGEARQMYYRTIFGQRVSEYELRAAVGESLVPGAKYPSAGPSSPPDGDCP